MFPDLLLRVLCCRAQVVFWAPKIQDASERNGIAWQFSGKKERRSITVDYLGRYMGRSDSLGVLYFW